LTKISFVFNFSILEDQKKNSIFENREI